MSRLLPVILVAACKQQSAEPAASEPPPPPPPPTAVQQPGSVSLDALAADLPLADIAGFTSGQYHTSSNLPVVYRDGGRWLGAAKYASGPIASAADFETFLLENHYDANGKAGRDHMQHVTINGSDMVVTTMAELMPEMPADLRAHFTDGQYAALEKALPRELLKRAAKRAPLAWTSSGGIEVIGADGTTKTFAVAKANDAFAALGALAH